MLLAVIARPVVAQPAAPQLPPATTADIDRARQLYRSAETAMQDGRFDDAVRDYDAAHALTDDPALYFKLGRAHERAGRCAIAVGYYERYLRDGAPAEPFVATTHERIAACRAPGAAPDGAVPSPEPSPAPPEPPPAPAPAPPIAQLPAEAAAPTSITLPTTSQRVAWLATGSAVALVTLGGILAYAARSSENDVRDLYVGFAGQTPTFDAATRREYDDLVDKGRRYQHLSWASFGLAGAAAVTAGILFLVGRHDADAPPVLGRVTPVATPQGAGVVVKF